MSRSNLASTLLCFAMLLAGCADDSPVGDVAEDELNSRTIAAIAPTDVSLLLPPPVDPSPTHLAPATLGRGGAMIPTAVLNVLPKKLDHASTREGQDYYQNLRVVGVRLDPCAGTLGAEMSAGCTPQVRLVFQGMSAGSTDDGALHAFYRLSRTQILSLVDFTVRERLARNVSADVPLGVHPVAVAEGIRGRFVQSFFAKLQALCGAENLERVTFIVREAGRPKAWTFGQFAVRGGAPTPLPVPTLTTDSQSLRGDAVSPMSPDPDNFLSLPPFDPTAVDRALRIENPNFHTPDTMACVECHQTQRVLALFPSGNRNEFRRSDVSSAVIGNDRDPENIHFFSYNGMHPSVSQRTGNETAAAVVRFRSLARGR
jgi:hypothetical protein